MMLVSTKIKFMLNLAKCVSGRHGGVRYFVEEGEWWGHDCWKGTS